MTKVTKKSTKKVSTKKADIPQKKRLTGHELITFLEWRKELDRLNDKHTISILENKVAELERELEKR